MCFTGTGESLIEPIQTQPPRQVDSHLVRQALRRIRHQVGFTQRASRVASLTEGIALKCSLYKSLGAVLSRGPLTCVAKDVTHDVCNAAQLSVSTHENRTCCETCDETMDRAETKKRSIRPTCGAG